MTNHEILVATKGYLLNHGWRQGGMGTPGGPRCVLGALNSACPDDQRLAGEAGGALASVIRTSPLLWNDRPGRTFDEVIAALDAAIIQTAPKDTPAPQPETPSPSVTHVFA